MIPGMKHTIVQTNVVPRADSFKGDSRKCICICRWTRWRWSQCSCRWSHSVFLPLVAQPRGCTQPSASFTGKHRSIKSWEWNVTNHDKSYQKLIMIQNKLTWRNWHDFTFFTCTIWILNLNLNLLDFFARNANQCVDVRMWSEKCKCVNFRAIQKRTCNMQGLVWNQYTTLGVQFSPWACNVFPKTFSSRL